MCLCLCDCLLCCEFCGRSVLCLLLLCVCYEIVVHVCKINFLCIILAHSYKQEMLPEFEGAV